MRGIIVFVLLVFILVACSQESNKRNLADDLNKVMVEANIQYEKVYHIEVVKDGVLVFYKDQFGGLSAGFIRDMNDYWKWVIGGGSVELDNEDGLSWGGSNHQEVPLYYMYGVISNPNINEVKTREKTAKIVKTEEGTKIWFMFFDKPINGYSELTGMSGDGKLLFPKR